MFVDVTEHGVRVGDAGNLRSLSVRVSEGVDAHSAIAPVGVLDADGTHAWLVIDALRTLALGSVAADEHDDWNDGFSAMVAYATSKGWTSADQRALRAHLEQV